MGCVRNKPHNVDNLLAPAYSVATEGFSGETFVLRDKTSEELLRHIGSTVHGLGQKVETGGAGRAAGGVSNQRGTEAVNVHLMGVSVKVA